MKELHLHLSPTQTKFVFSEADIVQIIGPMGEGKTYAAAVAPIYHAIRCNKDIRGALIRDTHTNLEISTIPDMKDMFGSRVTFHNDNRQMIYHTTPKVTLDLYGIDDPAALSKLQGPVYAFGWMEEPAPIKQKANAGLSVDVFNLLLARASRQAGTKMRLQLSQNPADEEHWSEELANMPRVYMDDPESGMQLIKETYRIPYGENAYLNQKTRLANKAAFAGDSGMYSRYVLGVAAPVRMGASVTPYYNPEVHYSKDELKVVKGGDGIIGLDGWHSSTAVLCQYVPPGRLIVHEVLTGEGAGVEELIQGQLIPRMRSPKYRDVVNWRVIGDPSMTTPDQSSVNRSASKVVESLLQIRFEKGMARWDTRRQSLSNALTRNCPDGQPQVRISCTAHPLHQALNGGWHYKVDNSGNIMSDIPVKEKHSHRGDAFSYPVSLLFSPVEKKKSKGVRRPPKRAKSYGNVGVGV